ncbi:hypothetical protein D3C86_1215540 [compost metagenome]
MHDLAGHQGEDGLDPLDGVLARREVVLGEDAEVREAAGLEPPLHRLLVGEPGAALGVEPERLHAVQAVTCRVQLGPAQGLAAHEPVEREPWVVAGDTGGIRARPQGDPRLAHGLDGRGVCGLLLAVAGDEVLALEGHPVLDGDPAAQRLDARQVARRHRLGVVEEPAQAIEGDLSVDGFEHVQVAPDRLVVGRMDPEGPALGDQQPHHPFKLRLHGRGQLGAGLDEVLEVRGRPDEVLAAALGDEAVGLEHVVVLAGVRQLHPAREVLELMLSGLSEEVVGDPHGEQPFTGELAADRVVVGVVLGPAARVDRAGDAEAVELAQELPGGVALLLVRQPGDLGEGGVEDGSGRRGEHEARRIAFGVALEAPARHVGGLFVEPEGAEARTVDEGPVVEVQDEGGGVGQRLVDLVEGRQAPLLELVGRPAAHHPDPLAGRCPRCLAPEQVEGDRKRGDAVPAKLQVVVQAFANDVQVRVVEPRHHGPAPQVDDARAGLLVCQRVLGLTCREYSAVFQGQG